ncbi:hypothetical protein H4S08_002320 [Coemansia sp. RSA 1365]|nr:hypothetical protein H4S08_002320 [Coemansia sp. RSA 1365]
MGPVKSSEKRGKPNSSPYHVFFQRELKRIKTENPTMSHKDAFKQAGLNWRTSLQNPKNRKIGPENVSPKNLESAASSVTAVPSAIDANKPAGALSGASESESAAEHAPAPALALAHESVPLPAPACLSVATPAPVPAPVPAPELESASANNPQAQVSVPDVSNEVSHSKVSDLNVTSTAESPAPRPPTEPNEKYTHKNIETPTNSFSVSAIPSMAAHAVSGANLTFAK